MGELRACAWEIVNEPTIHRRRHHLDALAARPHPGIGAAVAEANRPAAVWDPRSHDGGCILGKSNLATFDARAARHGSTEVTCGTTRASHVTTRNMKRVTVHEWSARPDQ